VGFTETQNAQAPNPATDTVTGGASATADIRWHSFCGPAGVRASSVHVWLPPALNVTVAFTPATRPACNASGGAGHNDYVTPLRPFVADGHPS
jgi:hypothetical protein